MIWQASGPTVGMRGLELEAELEPELEPEAGSRWEVTEYFSRLRGTCQHDSLHRFTGTST